jgi:hypothetical protein
MTTAARVRLWSAAQANLHRHMHRLDHGVHKDRCIWRSGHQFRWMTRICMRFSELDDGRQKRVWLIRFILANK